MIGSRRLCSRSNGADAHLYRKYILEQGFWKGRYSRIYEQKRWWAKLKKISSIGTLSNASISILVRNIGSTLDPATIISKISTLPDFSEAISHGTPLHPGVQKVSAVEWGLLASVLRNFGGGY